MTSFGMRHLFQAWKKVFHPANDIPCGPNAVQAEFLRLVAAQAPFVGLADTDHRSLAIQRFMVHPDTIDALHKAHQPYYFQEQRPSAQPYFDAVRSKSKYKALEALAQLPIEHGWLSLEDEETLRNVFERSARTHPDVRFIAADCRTSASIATNIPKRQAEKANLLLLMMVLAVKQGKTFDLEAERIAIGLTVASLTTFMQNLIDDGPTAEYIQSFGKGGALRFGRDHLKKIDGRLAKFLIDKSGDFPVLQIYANETQRENDDNYNETADGNLFVESSAAHPSGIEILNDLYQPVFEQAKANIDIGKFASPLACGRKLL